MIEVEGPIQLCAHADVHNKCHNKTLKFWEFLGRFFFISRCCPALSELLPLWKNTRCSNTQQSITPNCRTHIINNKYPRTSYNCNLMLLRFTSICDMLV